MEGYVRVQDLSVPSFQLCCEPKTARKNDLRARDLHESQLQQRDVSTVSI